MRNDTPQVGGMIPMQAGVDLVAQLETILQDLRRRARSVKGSVVVDSNGLPIASDIAANLDITVIAAMSTLIMQSADSVCENTGVSPPEFILIESKQANIAVVHLGQADASFLAFLDNSANLGLLKIEMKKAAIRLAEVLGLGSIARPAVAELFIMHSSGLLLRHYSDSLRTDIDRDILGGMLVAVQQFVKETLATKQGSLDELRYGEYTICFLRGTYTVAAAVVRGRISEDVKYPIYDALQEFEEKFSNQLRNWTGDLGAVAGIDDFFMKVIRG